MKSKCSYKRVAEGGLTQTHRRKRGSETMEAEPGVMWPRAKGCWQPSEARIREKQILSPRDSGGSTALQAP